MSFGTLFSATRACFQTHSILAFMFKTIKNNDGCTDVKSQKNLFENSEFASLNPVDAFSSHIWNQFMIHPIYYWNYDSLLKGSSLLILEKEGKFSYSFSNELTLKLPQIDSKGIIFP